LTGLCTKSSFWRVFNKWKGKDLEEGFMEKELKVLLEGFRCARDTGGSEGWDRQVYKLQDLLFGGQFKGVLVDDLLTIYHSSRCASKELVILCLELLYDREGNNEKD